MKDNYQLLIEKLDAFIRKYYKNQLIRGAIYAVGIGLAFFLAVTLLESAGRFSTGLRTALFYAFVAGNAVVLVRYIVIPLARLYRIGKLITHEEAARIIGSHFGEVSDKLLNTLQLREQYLEGRREGSAELLLAGISQKIEELRPVPFVSAINLGDNRRYLRYAAIPLVVLGAVLLMSPSMIKDSTQRLLHHGTYFEKPAPFTFRILNKDLKAVQQKDFTLEVQVTGDELPATASLATGGNDFRMEKESQARFRYTFRNVQKSMAFRLTADGFSSPEYRLEALPSPFLMNFVIDLDYPAYLHRAPETVHNTGDLVVPAGTRATWKFNTRNTESLALAFADTTLDAARKGEAEYSCSRRFFKNTGYSIAAANRYLRSSDSLRFSVSVIPDQYPTISVEQQRDSMSTKRIFFRGVIKDDYGFTGLAFRWHFLKKGGAVTAPGEGNADAGEPIAIPRDVTSSAFYYSWDAGTLDIAAGDEIEYYFEVRDNDGLAGPKTTRSAAQVFKAPTLKEVEEQTAKQSESIKQDLRQSLQEAGRLQKEADELNKKLMEKKEAGWDDRKKAEELMKKQEELAKKLEEIRRQNEQKNALHQEYKKNDDLLDKQQQLQELMQKLMNPELQKLLDELQKLLQQADKDQLQQQLENMKSDNKDLQKDLDRALELFKQLEFEQKMKDNISKLNDLAKKQDELAKKSDDAKAESQDLLEQQQELSKDFEDFRKDMNDLEKKNQELEHPNDLQNTDLDEKDIQNEQQNSEQELGKNQKSKAGKSQKNASGKMKQLAQKMEKMQQDMDAEQAQENIDDLRALLENLLRLSFDQEQLMQRLRTMDINDPRYLQAMQDQRKLKDDARMIEDSLAALSRRVMQIQQDVSKEINAINQHTDDALAAMEERYVPQARSHQQYVMTAVNNLALLLSEALKQMQQQSNSSSSSKASSSCTKPGSGKPKTAGQLRKMQEALNRNMEKLKEQLKQQGNKPQKGKTGQQQEGGLSEQLAKMAAEQEYIRNELGKLNQQENKDGQKALGDLEDIAKKMEESENDIVNKMITDQTLKRQQEILTRLLESERAEQQREQDPQRQSEQAKNNFNRNPDAFEEYKRLQQKEMELLRTVPPSLNPYYRKKVNDYFETIEK